MITGGSGMVGRHLVDILQDASYPTRQELDLLDFDRTLSIIQKYRPDHIIHCAAKVGGIMDNILCPYNFFEENILMNTNLIKASIIAKIPKLTALLSTCAFPDILDEYPMTEEDLHKGPPTKTNFSYGYAKRCMAVQIDSSNQQYGTKYNYLLPCNLYSEYDKTDSTNKMHFITALLKKIQYADDNRLTEIELYGTGQPLRQFMYAGDLAQIIKLVIDQNITESFCVAPHESNFSIDYMAKTILSILNKEYIHIKYDKTKPDGQYRKDVSNNRMTQYIDNFIFSSFQDTIPKIYQSYVNN